MDFLIQALPLAGILGTAAIGGVFFAFSSFVMPALGRLSAEQGLAAMQSINVAVIRASFLGPFVGTALLSLGAVAFALRHWGEPGAGYLAAAGVFYFVGTFLVTGICNVPLNNALATIASADARAAETWVHYLQRWTLWNHVRTLAALIATLSFALAIAERAAG